MNIAFRADASYEMGSGHVVRSLVLADTIAARGCSVVFVCRLLDGHLINLIRGRGFEVVVLGGASTGPKSATSTDWLGVSQQDDADDTIESLRGRLIDIFLVDHYSLDTDWETLIKPHVGSIVVIDDLANRDHNCDFLIDQNFRNDNSSCYEALVPDTCKTMLGLRYAILAPEYRDFRKTMSPRSGTIDKVLVYFGGTDWQNMTIRALKVLSQDEFRFLEVEVVVGSNYPFLSDLQELIAKRPKTNLHQSLPNLANLMSVADLAIGAGGTTMWERMSMGLPALVISLADNQLPACESLQKENLIHYLGGYNDFSDGVLTNCLRQQVANRKQNFDLSYRISQYVDGLGSLRIVQEILPPTADLVNLRVCKTTDYPQIFQIGSDAASFGALERYSFESMDSVEATLQKDLDANDCSPLSIEHNGLVLGVIKHQYNSTTDSIVISYCLDKTVKDMLEKLVLKSAEMVLLLMPIINPVDRSFDDKACFMFRLSNGCVQNRDLSLDSGKQLVLVTAKGSWINDHIAGFYFELLLRGHAVRWVHELYKPLFGDICFYLGFDKIVPLSFREKFHFNLVVHESALPQGRGWSPLSWQILEDQDEVYITLLDAADEVDSGVIFLQDKMTFDGSELIEQIRTIQAQKTFKLCHEFLRHPEVVSRNARKQHGDISYYPRRLPEDSKLDINKPISELFNRLRIADPVRYPSYFRLRNSKYKLIIQKLD
ncbi:UDP-2,4-diacetamido-2,4,6-trideoxy-beta-L-altropyranose hydrolase [Pseudomonadales bacterium]|nr:UDP-2,4-diacetamido-2,4,6-trideoxy-beta-L-altropyranose hydrolase [Pseudomonadales bacterium]